MGLIFVKIVNMSVAATWLILAVVLLRLVLGRGPRWVLCLLWALVAFRLVCPFSLESGLSLIPSVETIPAEILYQQPPLSQAPADLAIPPVLAPAISPAVAVSGDRVQTLAVLGTLLWLAGMGLMFLYALVSYLRLRRRVAEAIPLRGRLWLCDAVRSPFILGVVRPRVYLPSVISGGQASYIAAHEEAHLRRGDQWWKPLGFLILTLHWFNPFAWLAYSLFCRDLELACDERVAKGLSPEERKAYARALVEWAAPRLTIAACPVAFGEVGVKQRVKAALNYKKPAFWLVMAIVIAGLVLALCFGTDPREIPALTLEDVIALSAKGEDLTWSDFEAYGYQEAGSGLYIRHYEIDEEYSLLIGGPYPGEAPWYIRLVANEDHDDYVDIRAGDVESFVGHRKAGPPETSLSPIPPEALISAAILERNNDRGDFLCESHVILDSVQGPEGVTLYALVLHLGYSLIDGALFEVGGSYIPTALTFSVGEDGQYTLSEYWTPRDGGYHAPDIREKFPAAIAEQAIFPDAYQLNQHQDCRAQAVEHWRVDTAPIIRGLLEEICSSPSPSSAPQDYIDQHYLAYQELLYYGEYTRSYIESQLAQAPQEDLQGQIMRQLLQDL